MPRDRESILDILDSVEAIVDYVRGLSRDDFEDDQLRQDAVIRRFEIIGEAAKRVSEDCRNRHAEIPWKVMAGMRDRVIHGYDTVDVDVVWRTIVNDLPDLERNLRLLLDEEDNLCPPR